MRCLMKLSSYCTVKGTKGEWTFLWNFYYVTVPVCHCKKPVSIFYLSSRYYTGIITQQGRCYGRIRSSRSHRFTAHTTITGDKQTSLTWKPMLRSLLSWFLVGVCICARATGKDALAVKVTFNGFARFFTCIPRANMKSITWHHHGNRLIFFRALVVGEIHKGHRCTVVPTQWIIVPVPGRGLGGHRGQWRRGRPWAWTRYVFVNGRWRREGVGWWGWRRQAHQQS